MARCSEEEKHLRCITCYICSESLRLSRRAHATMLCWHGDVAIAVFVLQTAELAERTCHAQHRTQVSHSGVTWSGANKARAVGLVSFKIMQKFGGRMFSEDPH